MSTADLHNAIEDQLDEEFNKRDLRLGPIRREMFSAADFGDEFVEQEFLNLVNELSCTESNPHPEVINELWDLFLIAMNYAQTTLGIKSICGIFVSTAIHLCNQLLASNRFHEGPYAKQLCEKLSLFITNEESRTAVVELQIRVGARW